MVKSIFMKNQLADIPDQIVQLEVLHDEGGFSSVQELRDKYRDVHLRKALSGQLQTDNPDARKLPQLRHSVIQGAGKGLPDYPSRYFEWLRSLPLREVENYADSAIRDNQRFPFLTRANQLKSILKNKIKEGISPTSVLCRIPTEFISEKTDGKKQRCEIHISNFQILFMFHMQAKGMAASRGFEDKTYRLRLFALNKLFAPDFIRHVNENAGEEVKREMCSGDYKKAVDILLSATNEFMRKYNFRGI